MKNKNIFFFSFIILIIFFTSSSFSQTNDDCLVCHSDPDLSMERGKKKISLFTDINVISKSVHKKLSCVSCHKGFKHDEIPHKEKIEPIKCSSCHKDVASKHVFHPKLTSFGEKSGVSGQDCKECHGTHNVVSTKSPAFKFNSKNLINACGECHKDVKADYEISNHHIAFLRGQPFSPNCLTCHKNNISNYFVKKDTLAGKIAQEKLCISCHVESPEVIEKMPAHSAFIYAYENSIHGLNLIKKGNKKSANCVDCHNSHLILNKFHEKSSISKLNVASTCGKCHDKAERDFNISVHGKALAGGNLLSPTCTDCHGEHNILSSNDPKAPVSIRNVSFQVCSSCHASVKLIERTRLSAKQVESFNTSYHGLALRGGDTEAANCASCHMYHDILPSTDPNSSIHPANLAATCGSCHPGANEKFAIGKVHVTESKEDEPILYWISTIYIYLIVVLISGMFLHNLIDFIRKAIRKRKIRLGLIKVEHHGHGLYLRMTLNERIQHFLLMISFFTLVITGFALRFPEAEWVKFLRDLIPGFFELRSLLHRIAAVVMVVDAVYHAFYLAFTERGRQLFKDLLPKYQDLKDAIGVMKYNLGFSPVKPKLDRFSYVEKAEYWALVWGTIIMTITGIFLWFDNTFMGLFTKLGYDISRTIHYYEAWLAFLSIIVWHLYAVIFNPDVYPMNLAWIKGTLTEEEMADEHPLELERIKKAQMNLEKSEENSNEDDKEENTVEI